MAAVREGENSWFFQFRNKKQEVHPTAEMTRWQGRKRENPTFFLIKDLGTGIG